MPTITLLFLSKHPPSCDTLPLQCLCYFFLELSQESSQIILAWVILYKDFFPLEHILYIYEINSMSTNTFYVMASLQLFLIKKFRKWPVFDNKYGFSSYRILIFFLSYVFCTDKQKKVTVNKTLPLKVKCSNNVLWPQNFH